MRCLESALTGISTACKANINWYFCTTYAYWQEI